MQATEHPTPVPQPTNELSLSTLNVPTFRNNESPVPVPHPEGNFDNVLAPSPALVPKQEQRQQFLFDKDRSKRCVTVKEFCESNPKYKFICKGLIIASPWSPCACFITFPLVAVPSGFFFYHVGYNFLYGQSGWTGYSLFALDILLLGIVVLSLFMTTFRDPGIIPRSQKMPGDPTYGAEVLDANQKRWKFCVTCNIWRPPRSKHCSTNDVCIRVYDHFCPWVGNSIGARNQLSFIVFVTSLIVYIIVIASQFVMSDTVKYGKLDEFGMFMFFMVFISIVGILVCWLFCSTMCNISRGLTTNEAVLERYEYQDTAYNFCMDIVYRFKNQPSQLLMERSSTRPVFNAKNTSI